MSTYRVTMLINGMRKERVKISTCPEDAEVKARSRFLNAAKKYSLVSVERIGDAFVIPA